MKYEIKVDHKKRRKTIEVHTGDDNTQIISLTFQQTMLDDDRMWDEIYRQCSNAALLMGEIIQLSKDKHNIIATLRRAR